MTKSIKDLSTWSNADITAGMMRQQRTIAACRIAMQQLQPVAQILERSGGRNPIETIKALGLDSAARGTLLQMEAKARGMIPALEAEGILPVASAITQAVDAAMKGGE